MRSTGMFSALVIAGLSAMAPIAAVRAAPIYTFSNFDVGLPSRSVDADGINDKGQVSGTYLLLSGYQGFTYDLASGAVTTYSLPGLNQAFFAGINNFGEIVGYTSMSTLFYKNSSQGFSLDTSSGAYTILNVPATNGVQAFGVNDAGIVVGTYSNFAGPFGLRGFLFDPLSGKTTTIPPASMGDVELQDINNRGQVVGNVNGSGFLFDTTTGTTTIFSSSIVPGGFTAINDVGQIAGNYTDSSLRQEGFVFDIASNTYTTLIDPSAGFNTIILGINNAGQVAGYYEDGRGYHHPFVATPQGAASVPEPASLALLGIGVIGLLAWRSRGHPAEAAFNAP